MEFVERETGAFPVSIGTSLALEGLFGIHPKQPNQPPGSKRISEIWINVRTLIRNLHAAMTADQAEKAPLGELLEILLQELKTIPNVFQQQGGRYRAHFYHNNLDELGWMFPKAQRKQPKTQKQIHYHTIETFLTNQLMQVADEQNLPIARIRREPPVNHLIVALLTHYPHELLWRHQFEGLFLLESHTGRLKSYSQWGSKLNGVTAEDHMPFNQFTLQLFGDGVLLDSFPRKLRDEFKQLAETRRWTAVTTLEKIKTDIRQYGGEQLRLVLADLGGR